MTTKTDKQPYREQTWQELQDAQAGSFPFPLKGRIPNFKGAKQASAMLMETQEWQNAQTVKINPDTPQQPLRERALKEGKTLLMPTPRLKEGFLLLTDLQAQAKEASSIKGASKYGRTISIHAIPQIDLLVSGAVALSKQGDRLGKGHGYGELEYGICRELTKIGSSTPVASTVHDLQVYEEPLPQDDHDVPVNLIATPTRLLRTQPERHQPQGILWHKITEKMMQEMPVLEELKDDQGL